MKALKKIVTAIISAAFIMSSAATVLADETTATTKPSETAAATSQETQETFDISKLSFDTMYGNQIGDFLNHEYYYNGQKIPQAETNYYFLLTFLQLSQYAAYGYYPATSAGYIDLAATYGDSKKTFADYFVSEAEEYLHSTYIFLERAKAAGIKLSDDDKKAIEEEIKERTEEQAKPAGVSLDVILELYFGPGCNEKAYRQILENATLAGKYQEKFTSEYKIPEEQLMVPNIAYALFYAPGASASPEDKKKAETAANEMLKKCKSIDDLKKYAAEEQKAGKVYDQSTLSVPKGRMVSAFESWAWDASRKVGELGVIYSEEYGYFCVGYVGKVKLEKDEQAELANDALTKEIEAEMKANKKNFHTDMKYGAAKAAPTAVPVTEAPEQTGNGNGTGNETVPSGLPTDNGTPADNGMSKVLIIVFCVIGGVAIIAVIVILVMNYKGSNMTDDEMRTSKKSSSAKKTSRKIEDDDEDEDEEEEEEETEPEEAEDPYSGIDGDDPDEEPEEEKPAKDKGNNKKNKKHGK